MFFRNEKKITKFVFQWATQQILHVEQDLLPFGTTEIVIDVLLLSCRSVFRFIYCFYIKLYVCLLVCFVFCNGLVCLFSIYEIKYSFGIFHIICTDLYFMLYWPLNGQLIVIEIWYWNTKQNRTFGYITKYFFVVILIIIRLHYLFCNNTINYSDVYRLFIQTELYLRLLH